MTYDSELDIETFRQSVELGEVRLTVVVRKYGAGLKKLQVIREYLSLGNGTWVMRKLGRLTYDELEVLLPILNLAFKDHMSESSEDLDQDLV